MGVTFLQRNGPNTRIASVLRCVDTCTTGTRAARYTSAGPPYHPERTPVGASYRTKIFEFCPNEAELFRRWKAEQADDMYERGHGAYEGTIGHTDLRVSNRTFATLAEVRAFAENQHVDKRDAIAWRYGAGAPVFPATAKDRDLAALCQKLADEVELFEHSILKRFVLSKSASKRCTHCDSVISKKSREPLARQDFKRQLAQLSNPFERRDYIAEQTNCPACHHNLLLTDTDTKRRTALVTRSSEQARKLEQAKTEFLAKAKPYGYYVLACVPE
jgi:hypothetical protein